MIDGWMSSWYDDLNRRKVKAPTTKLIFPKNSGQRRTLVALLATTAQVESNFTAVEQKGGPALSIFQVEPRTAMEIWNKHGMWIKNADTLIDTIRGDLTPLQTIEKALVDNQSIAMSFARLVYYRTPKPIPYHCNWQEIWGYYKRYYNTYLGATTKERWYDSTAEIRAEYDARYR